MGKKGWVTIAVVFVIMAMIISARYASNKSKEILDKFHQVNSTLDSSGNFQKPFDSALKTALSNQVDYIEFLKNDIIKRSGGIDSSTGDLIGRDNIDVPTEYLVDEHIGDTLMIRTLEFERVLLDMINDDSSRHEIETHFEWLHSKGTGNSWSVRTFNHIPAVAAVTILNKLKNDCVAAEGVVLEATLKKPHSISR